jgi:uncharacterized RDD family membrane protein YckC
VRVGRIPLALNVYFLHRHGQSAGKRMLAIMIVRADGRRVDVGRVLALRATLPVVVSWIPIIGPLLALANVLYIFGRDQRCIHDYIADTRVVEVPPTFTGYW